MTSSLTFPILDVFICDIELCSCSQLLCNNSPQNSVASNNHRMSDHHSPLELGSAGRSCLGSLLRLQSFGSWPATGGYKRPHSCGSCLGTSCHPGPSLARGLSSSSQEDRSSLHGGKNIPREKQKLYLLMVKAAERAHYHSVTSYWPGDATRGGETDSAS